MTQIVHIALPQFQTLLVILVRIGGIMAALPLLRSRSIPLQLKTGLVLMLGLVLMPIVRVTGIPDDPVLLAIGLTAEFLVGLVLGLGVRFLFSGIEMAGELMSSQMGLGMAQLFDPTISHQVHVVGQYQTLIASLAFLSLNAHYVAVEAVAASFDLVPPFSAALSPALVDDVIRLSQGLFVIGLKLAAPVAVTILLINLGLAILGRAVAQINVFLLSFPLTIAGGFVIMGVALPYAVGVYEAEYLRLEETIHGLMRMLGHG